MYWKEISINRIESAHL